MSYLPPEAEVSNDLVLDDLEVETSALADEADEEAQPYTLSLLYRLLPRMRFWRRVLVWWAFALSLLLALCVLVAQIETAPATSSAPPPGPAAPLRVNDQPTGLGAAPPYCLTAPAPRPILPGIGAVVGSAPVWVAGFDGPWATLHVATIDPVLATRYGWATDLRWEVGLSFTGALLVRGQNLRTSAALWFRLPNQAATNLLLLDTRASHAASPLGNGWAEWLSEVSIPASGCYLLEATWPGGHWQITFAAGRAVQQTIPPARYCRGQEAPCIPVGLPPGP